MAQTDDNLTQKLVQWSGGDQAIEAELINSLYPYLYQSAQKQLNKEAQDMTLQTTEIVNEAYIKLRNNNQVKWQSRLHFRALAAGIIRRILIDHFRSKHRKKRGGFQAHVTYDKVAYAIADQASDQCEWLMLDQQLQRLKRMDALSARIVELRYFGGLTVEEAAQQCQVSVSTAVRNWRFARGWLQNQMKG